MKWINRDAIISVYSGKNGKCCCGCSGSHRYASAYVGEITDSRRDWAVVNDHQVEKVIGIIEAAEDSAKNANNISTVVGDRLYIAYFRDEQLGGVRQYLAITRP